MSFARKLRTALGLARTRQWRMLRARVGARFAVRRLQHARCAFAYRRHGFPMVCHPDWADSVDCFLGDLGDWWDISVMQRWLEPGDMVLDVGANVGVYTFAAAARVGPRGRIVAIDASPFVAGKLAESAHLLHASGIEVVNTAITSRRGSVPFFVRADGHGTGAQSLRHNSAPSEPWTAVNVPARTLVDAAGTDLARLALIKMDIEGAECDALADVPREWFTRDGPFWLVEINPSALANFAADPATLLARFPASEFERWLLAKDPVIAGRGPRLQDVGDKADFTDSSYYNLFAIPRGAKWTQRVDRLRKLRK